MGAPIESEQGAGTWSEHSPPRTALGQTRRSGLCIAMHTIRSDASGPGPRGLSRVCLLRFDVLVSHSACAERALSMTRFEVFSEASNDKA